MTIIYDVEELKALPRLTTIHTGWGDVYHSNYPDIDETVAWWYERPVAWWDKHGEQVNPLDICLPAVVLDGPVAQ